MKVLVYTLPNCVQCDMTKRQFDNAGVAYESIDLTDHPETAGALKKSYGFTQAPIVVTAGDVWSGFKLERIKGVISAIHAEQATKNAQI